MYGSVLTFLDDIGLTADCVDAIRDPSQDSGIVECGVSTVSGHHLLASWCRP